MHFPRPLSTLVGDLVPIIGATSIGPALAKMGAQGCVLVGDPAFYTRLGFSRCTHLTLPEVPPEYLLGKSFGHAMPRGEVSFSPAFAATS